MGWKTELGRLEERVAGLTGLMEAKFTTLRTVVDGQAQSTKLALDASEKAISKAEIATQKALEQTAADIKTRFASVNEFRGALADSQANNVARQEFEQFRKSYEDAHTALRTYYAEQLAELKGRLDKAEGRQGGVQNVWGVIVAVVGIAIAIGALVFRNLGGG